MKIVQLTQRYLDSFIELYVEFFKELRSKQGCSFQVEEFVQDAKRYFQRGDIIFLALENSKAIGFIRLSSREECFWIEEVYVRPEFRRRGIAKALVKRAEEEVSKQDDFLYLLVLPQDKDAITFWKKLGYDMINTIELVKNLRPTARGRHHVIELIGEPFKIVRWSEEEFSEEEESFLELLREFYERGETKEDFLRLVNQSLREWLKTR